MHAVSSSRLITHLQCPIEHCIRPHQQTPKQPARFCKTRQSVVFTAWYNLPAENHLFFQSHTHCKRVLCLWHGTTFPQTNIWFSITYRLQKTVVFIAWFNLPAENHLFFQAQAYDIPTLCGSASLHSWTTSTTRSTQASRPSSLRGFGHTYVSD